MIDGVVDIKKYFWDANPDAVDYDRHYFWIIERLLEFGGIEKSLFFLTSMVKKK